MTLTPGTPVGPYEIVSPLGAGGMGEVYRASDSRLGREVAIKSLPEAFAREPERLARFEREAKLLASLNHPNVAGIHGLEEVAGARYLVLEYVEGETLADRLHRGALPLDETVDIAKQIAAGVEAAHEKGVVHRDLKPRNVMLRPDGTVKVLDFGLAKSGPADGAGSNPSLTATPTRTHAETQPGMILGTAAYMSPEQARGKSVDKRTDVWSFGCILFECLTGRAVFEGETPSDLIARILEREPDWSAVPPETPARVRELLRRCLRKDPRERLRDIGDARLELADAMSARAESATPARSSRARAWMPAAVAVVAVAAGLAGGVALTGSLRKSAAPVRRFTIPAIDNEGAPSVSPDGRRVAFTNGFGLAIRDLTRFESTTIPGTARVYGPFWSPDSSRIGFYRDGKIFVSSLTGTDATQVCTVPSPGGFNGASWGKDGKIVFAVFRGGLYEVSARGGDPRLLVAPDASEVDFHWPDRIRDDGWILTIAHRKSGPRPVVLVSERDGARKNLREFDGVGRATYSPTGHLLLSIDENREQILAVPFSDDRRDITGDAFLAAAGGLYPTVSSDGSVMAYAAGASRALRELVWLNRDGHVEHVVGQPQHGMDFPAIRPDGSSVAIVAFDDDNANIWLQDLTRDARRRLVAGPRDETFPSWSGDGRRVVYVEWGAVEPAVMDVPVDGTSPPRSLGVNGWWPSMTPGGEALVFERDISGQNVIWRLDTGAAAGGAPAPVRLTQSTTFNEGSPALSPDGRWLAYMSEESEGSQVFVRRLADGARKLQVSLASGDHPFWSPDGRFLYYWDHETLMESAITVSRDSLELGEPHRLFTSKDAGVAASSYRRPPLVSAGAGRFLAVRRSADDPYDGFLVVENWAEEFR